MVRVHCGSQFVQGKARGYRYYVASLFVAYKAKNGRLLWRNSGIHTHPRRSRRLAANDGQELAQQHGVSFLPGYGSLHNHLC